MLTSLCHRAGNQEWCFSECVCVQAKTCLTAFCCTFMGKESGWSQIFQRRSAEPSFALLPLQLCFWGEASLTENWDGCSGNHQWWTSDEDREHSLDALKSPIRGAVRSCAENRHLIWACRSFKLGLHVLLWCYALNYIKFADKVPQKRLSSVSGFGLQLIKSNAASHKSNITNTGRMKQP